MQLIWCFLKYYKVYQSYTYVPILNNEKKFSLYTWTNWVWKSSVLQALDSFFNKSEWVLNLDAIQKKRQEESTISVSIWIDEKSLNLLLDWTDVDQIKMIKLIGKKTKKISKKRIQSQNKTVLGMEKRILEQEKWFSSKSKLEYDYVFSIDLNYKIQSKSNSASFWFLSKLREYNSNEDKIAKQISEESNSLSEIIYKKIYLEWFTYVYIPAELNANNLLDFTSKKLISLLDKDLFSVIDDSLNFDNWKILNKINKSLKKFLTEFSRNISQNNQTRISLKHPERKKNLVASDLRQIIVESYFYTKYFTVNNKKISSLSSGEQKETIIDIMCQLLYHNNKQRNIVFAIDEPENSMHISNKLKPFEKLYEASLYDNIQVLVTTHRYWVIPSIDTWSLFFMEKENSLIKIKSFSLESYQEERRNFPNDIHFKCYFDLASNILSTMQIGYNRLLCEWSDDRVYLQKFIWNKVKNLKILCLWWIWNVIKMYKMLFSALIEERDRIKSSWKILALIDTDETSIRLDDFYLTKSKDVAIRRLQIVNDEVRFLNLWKNWNTSKTVIEDCLNPKTYYDAISELVRLHGDEKIKMIFWMCEFNNQEDISRTRWDKSIFRAKNISFINEWYKNELCDYIEKLENKYLLAKIYCWLDNSIPNRINHLTDRFIEN